MKKRGLRAPCAVLLLIILLSSCSTSPGQSLASFSSTPSSTDQTALASTALAGIGTATSSPRATASPSVTPTPDPDLPCGGIVPERVYLFLDCADIRRIRANLQAAPPDFMRIWDADEWIARHYVVPTVYDASESAEVLWWGSGNHIAQDMALIYLVTGDLAYAERERDLLELIRKNTHYGVHLINYGGDWPGGLLAHPKHGSLPFSSLVFGYLAIRDTQLFSEQERQEFDDFFVQQGFLAHEVSVRKGRIPLDSWINRNVPNSAAIIAVTMAVAFPAHPRSKELYDLARPELDWQMTNWWHPDGGWGEDSESYGFRQLKGLLILAEAMQKNMNTDIYQVDYGGKTIGTFCRHYLDLLTPNGMSPALNDSTHYYMDPGMLRLCAHRTNDPALAFAADNYRWGLDHAYGKSRLGWDQMQDTILGEIAWWGLPPAPQEPGFTSLSSSSSGFAILRSDWQHTASYLLLQFTSSTVHAERSFGAIYLYDGGPWMVGNGYHLADSSFGQEGQSTQQHTTLALDGSSQTETSGSLLEFADLNQTAILSVEGESYPNTTHRRSVVWIKPWHQWLVWDDISTFDNRTHSLQLRWYVRGEVSSEQDGEWIFSRSTGNPRYLSVSMFPPGQANFKEVERHYKSEAWVSDAVGVEMQAASREPLSRLVTAITSDTDIPSVTRVDEKEGTILTSVLDQLTWEWVVPSQAGATQIGSYSVDGTTGCLRRDGTELRGYCLFHGTDLKAGTQDLVRSSVALDLEADLDSSRVTLSVPSGADLSFYWAAPVTSVKIDTTSIQFLQQESSIQLALPAGTYVLTLE